MRFLTATFSKNFFFSVLSKREPPPLCFASMPSTSLAVGEECWEPKFENFYRPYEEPFYFFSRPARLFTKDIFGYWKVSSLVSSQLSKIAPPILKSFFLSLFVQAGTTSSVLSVIAFYFFSRQEEGVYQKNLRIWKKSSFWIKTWRCFWKNESVTLQAATSPPICRFEKVPLYFQRKI